MMTGRPAWTSRTTLLGLIPASIVAGMFSRLSNEIWPYGPLMPRLGVQPTCLATATAVSSETGRPIASGWLGVPKGPRLPADGVNVLDGVTPSG